MYIQRHGDRMELSGRFSPQDLIELALQCASNQVTAESIFKDRLYVPPLLAFLRSHYKTQNIQNDSIFIVALHKETILYDLDLVHEGVDYDIEAVIENVKSGGKRWRSSDGIVILHYRISCTAELETKDRILLRRLGISIEKSNIPCVDTFVMDKQNTVVHSSFGWS